MMTRIITIAIVVCSLSTPLAEAATWYAFVRISTESQIEFFDQDSVVKNNNNVTIWQKWIENPRTLKNGDSFETTVKIEYNCKLKTARMYSHISHDESGNTLQAFTQPGKTTDVVPGTIGEETLHAICKTDFPRKLNAKEFVLVKDNDPAAFAQNIFDNVTDTAPTNPVWYSFNSLEGPMAAAFFDYNSSKRISDNIELIVKIINNQPTKDGSTSSISKYLFYCGKQTYKIEIISVYDTDGKFMYSAVNRDNAEYPLTKDPIVKAMFDVACDTSFPNSKDSDLYTQVPYNDIQAMAKKMFVPLPNSKNGDSSSK